MLPKSRDVRDWSEKPCCCVCGREIKGTAWTCFACRARWGLDGSMQEWPEWARFLATSEQKRRRDTGRDVMLDIDDLDV